MKKILAAATCAFLAFALTACSISQASGSESSSAAEASSAQEMETTVSPTPTATPFPMPEIDEEGYVTGADPLTGKPQDADDTSRPVAVMIQNKQGAYPQWGLQGAKVLVEGLTEGSSTSLMALYSSLDKMPDKVGPVAEGRALQWQFALPAGSILANIGTNAYASNLLNTLSWQNLDGYYTGVASFDLDYARASTSLHEYSWYTSPSLLRSGMELYGMQEEGDRRSLFNFAADSDSYDLSTLSQATATATDADASLNQVQPADRLEITFCADNTVPVLYNEDMGKWEKYGKDWELHLDAYALEQDGYSLDSDDYDPHDYSLCYDNVLVLYASAGIKDDGISRDYDLTQGVGLYFRGPWCRLIRWQKNGATGGVHVYDAYGEELDMGTGSTYVAIYGGFDGQSIRAQSDGDDLTLWPDPDPLPEKALYQPAEEEQPEAEAESEGETAEDSNG